MTTFKKELLLDQKTIESKIRHLGKVISTDYQTVDNVCLIIILNGAFLFASELIKNLDISDVKIDFLKLKSYSGTHTTGSVIIHNDLTLNVTNKNIIVIEDIVDTGITASFIKNYFKDKVNSFRFCTLLDKPSKRIELFEPDYVGFSIPDKFVIGYGLDYNDKYRNLKNIYEVIL